VKQVLKRWVSAVRIWLGWGDISSERASPAHGWLLPEPVLARAPRADVLPVKREARG
jgi:hypothetical protein